MLLLPSIKGDTFDFLGKAGTGAGFQLITSTDTAFFAASGCSWPTYGTATTPPTAYFSATNTYWYVWQAWDGAARKVYCKTFKPDRTPQWLGPFQAAVDPLTDDDHGVPSIERDASGYVHLFYGAHGASPEQISHTTNPDDPSAWTADTALSINTTYPKPTMVGSSLWLFIRETVIGGTNGINPLVYFNTTALASGVPTWTAKITAIDYGQPGATGSRVYAGNFVLRGTDLHFCTTFADGDDNFRHNVYYYIFDTVNRTLRNFDGSTVIAEVSFPVLLGQSDTSFRIVDQQTGNTFGNVPALNFDTNGHPHVMFMDGPSGGPYDIKHIWHNGTAWQTPDLVGAGAGDALHRFDTYGVVPLPGGDVDLYWITQSSFAFVRGGDISKRKWSSGSLGTAGVVLAARSTFALDCIAVTRYASTAGTVDCRVMFAEISGAAVTESGQLRVFAYGDNGFLRCPFQTETIALAAAMAVQPADQGKLAIDEFYSVMKSYNYWTRFDVYYNMKLPTRQAQALNWVNPSLFACQDVGGGPTSTLNSHVAGNGTSTKWNTVFTPSIHATKAAQNNSGLYIHNLDSTVNDTYFDAGSGGTAFDQINVGFTGPITRGVVNAATNANSNTVGSVAGRSSIERSSSTLSTFVKDGGANGTAATASTGLGNGALHICGTTTGFSARQIRRVAFGQSFTAAERQIQRIWEIRYDFVSP